MSLTPWKILDSHYIHPRFRIDKVEVAGGRVFEPVVFEFRNWANVLALTKNNEAVLVRQYRHGVREMLLELPGGVVDDDENPLEGAGRELMEETGYSAGTIVEVGRIYPNPAGNQLKISGNEISHGSIYDMQGRKRMDFSGNEVQLDLLESGVYIIDIDGSETHWRTHFVRE